VTIIEEFHTPENVAAKEAGNKTVCLTPQPTRGGLLGVLPLLDYAVPTLPRSMTRREWRNAGYIVKPRATPIRKDPRIDGKFYDGKWHPWSVGIYTKAQCITVEEDFEAKQARVDSEKEWQTIQGRGIQQSIMTERLKVLTDGARRKYVYLHAKAKASNTAEVITNNADIAAACKIRPHALKGHRNELIRHGFIQYRLTVGRQSQITINALL
jgi:hypothetical protein